MHRSVSITFQLFALLLLALTLTACGGGGNDGESHQADTPTDAPIEEVQEVDETISIVDEYVCTDEREQAVAHTTLSGRFNYGVPALWEDTPFVVDISSTFPNADELLDVVAEEAAWIEATLGYEVFVAGDVLPFADLTSSELYYFDIGSQSVPPDQHIEIRCCYGEDSDSAGTSYAWWRIVLLENDAFQTRHIIIHELWHILGFTHPGNTPGVVMSDVLMYGPGPDANGASIPTQPAALDLAKLACIYDAGSNVDLTVAQAVH